MTDTCSTCRWWLAHGGIKTATGYCRKNAPVSYVYSDGTPAPKWPRTGPVDACGKHEAVREVAA
jgi:hypothetical protein